MGKFDGVLFFADYDDTLYNSHRAVSPENRAAIRYFMDNGGYFSIATGRAHRTFTPQIEQELLVFNAPVVLSNGAAIYDYAGDRYLLESFLPQDAPQMLSRLCDLFPALGFEAYHGEDIYVHNPNRVTREHLAKVGGTQILRPILDMPVSTLICIDTVRPWRTASRESCSAAAMVKTVGRISWRTISSHASGKVNPRIRTGFLIPA